MSDSNAAGDDREAGEYSSAAGPERPSIEPELPHPPTAPVPTLPQALPSLDTEPMLLSRESRGACLADLLIFGAFVASLLLGVRLLANAVGAPTQPSDTTTAPALQVPTEAEKPATDEEALVNFVATLAVGLIAVLVVAAIGFARRQRPPAFGLSTRLLPWNLFFGDLTTYACVAAQFAGVAIIYLVPGGVEQMMQNNLELRHQIPPFSAIALLLAFGWVGFYEELVFRGFLMPRLRRITGSWTIAVVASSALFGAAHMSSQEPFAVIPLFLIGMVLGTMTALRRSLIPAVIGHCLFDFGNVMYLRFFTKLGLAA